MQHAENENVSQIYQSDLYTPSILRSMTNELINGKLVSNFDQSIHPYFVPSLQEAKRDAILKGDHSKERKINTILASLTLKPQPIAKRNNKKKSKNGTTVSKNNRRTANNSNSIEITNKCIKTEIDLKDLDEDTIAAICKCIKEKRMNAANNQKYTLAEKLNKKLEFAQNYLKSLSKRAKPAINPELVAKLKSSLNEVIASKAKIQNEYENQIQRLNLGQAQAENEIFVEYQDVGSKLEKEEEAYKKYERFQPSKKLLDLQKHEKKLSQSLLFKEARQVNQKWKELEITEKQLFLNHGLESIKNKKNEIDKTKQRRYLVVNHFFDEKRFVLKQKYKESIKQHDDNIRAIIARLQDLGEEIPEEVLDSVNQSSKKKIPGNKKENPDKNNTMKQNAIRNASEETSDQKQFTTKAIPKTVIDKQADSSTQEGLINHDNETNDSDEYQLNSSNNNVDNQYDEHELDNIRKLLELENENENSPANSTKQGNSNGNFDEQNIVNDSMPSNKNNTKTPNQNDKNAQIQSKSLQLSPINRNPLNISTNSANQNVTTDNNELQNKNNIQSPKEIPIKSISQSNPLFTDKQNSKTNNEKQSPIISRSIDSNDNKVERNTGIQTPLTPIKPRTSNLDIDSNDKSPQKINNNQERAKVIMKIDSFLRNNGESDSRQEPTSKQNNQISDISPDLYDDSSNSESNSSKMSIPKMTLVRRNIQYEELHVHPKLTKRNPKNKNKFSRIPNNSKPAIQKDESATSESELQEQSITVIATNQSSPNGDIMVRIGSQSSPSKSRESPKQSILSTDSLSNSTNQNTTKSLSENSKSSENEENSMPKASSNDLEKIMALIKGENKEDENDTDSINESEPNEMKKIFDLIKGNPTPQRNNASIEKDENSQLTRNVDIIIENNKTKNHQSHESSEAASTESDTAFKYDARRRNRLCYDEFLRPSPKNSHKAKKSNSRNGIDRHETSYESDYQRYSPTSNYYTEYQDEYYNYSSNYNYNQGTTIDTETNYDYLSSQYQTNMYSYNSSSLNDIKKPNSIIYRYTQQYSSYSDDENHTEIFSSLTNDESTTDEYSEIRIKQWRPKVLSETEAESEI